MDVDRIKKKGYLYFYSVYRSCLADFGRNYILSITSRNHIYSLGKIFPNENEDIVWGLDICLEKFSKLCKFRGDVLFKKCFETMVVDTTHFVPSIAVLKCNKNGMFWVFEFCVIFLQTIFRN